MTRLFGDGTHSGNNLVLWWDGLGEHTADRASLRRARDAAETIQVPYVHALIHSLRKDATRLQTDRIGAICGLMSHVRTHKPGISFARQMSRPRGGSGDQPVISNVRFRRILQYEDIARDGLFYQNLVRIIKNLDHTIDVPALAHSIYNWGTYSIKRWAYDYYGTAFSNEDTTTPNGENT
jgi:CRISPR system Cascade subunit CasB